MEEYMEEMLAAEAYYQENILPDYYAEEQDAINDMYFDMWCDYQDTIWSLMWEY